MRFPTPDITTANGAAVIPMSKSRKQHWSDEAKAALRHATKEWEFFTVDDLNELMERKGLDRGNFGPIINWGRKRGIVQTTGAYIASDNGPKQVWMSTYRSLVAS